MYRLTKEEARRIAVRAQRLDAERPAGLVELVRHLTLLQLDPTAAVAPNADLVAWSRLGSSYEPAELARALAERQLFELDAVVRPIEDVGLVLAEWPPHPSIGAWVEANERFRRDIVKLLAIRGDLAIAGRVGRQRLWDVAERVYPAGVVTPSPEEARRIRNERRLAALGIARTKSTKMPLEPIDVGDAGEPAVVEGVTGEWRVDPAYLEGGFEGRTALLSPFDRLAYDRVRSVELFDFEYTLEMYKPASKRRWGYFALPILHGDRLVGKLDAVADRKAAVFRVNAIHEDVRFTKAMTKAVQAEIAALANWLGLPDEFAPAARS